MTTTKWALRHRARQTPTRVRYLAAGVSTNSCQGTRLQYDDGVGEIQVMREFGHSRIFAGRANWDKLGITLAPGTYIFDIEGHTVKVRAVNQIAPNTVIARLGDYFEPESDKSNYNTSEFLKPVTSIWKK